MNDVPTRSWRPAYVALARSGELETRVAELEAGLRCCRLCPHECGVDRVVELLLKEKAPASDSP